MKNKNLLSLVIGILILLGIVVGLSGDVNSAMPIIGYAIFLGLMSLLAGNGGESND